MLPPLPCRNDGAGPLPPPPAAGPTWSAVDGPAFPLGSPAGAVVATDTSDGSVAVAEAGGWLTVGTALAVGCAAAARVDLGFRVGTALPPACASAAGGSGGAASFHSSVWLWLRFRRCSSNRSAWEKTREGM